MTFENINFFLALLGTLLGLISAYPTIKEFVVRLFRLTGERAKRWIKIEDERAELFLSYPSALVAYTVRALILVAALWVVGDLYRQAVRTDLIVINSSVNSLLRFIIGVLPGLQIGRLFSVFQDVISLAKRKQRNSKTGG